MSPVLQARSRTRQRFSSRALGQIRKYRSMLAWDHWQAHQSVSGLGRPLLCNVHHEFFLPACAVLLTLPWAAAAWVARVDLDDEKGEGQSHWTRSSNARAAELITRHRRNVPQAAQAHEGVVPHTNGLRGDAGPAALRMGHAGNPHLLRSCHSEGGRAVVCVWAFSETQTTASCSSDHLCRRGQ